MKNVVLLCSLLSLCSCATIVSSSTSPIIVQSTPSGAKVEISDRNGVTKFVGETPATAILANGDGYFKKARYTVKVTKDGYDPSISNIVADLNGWYFGNIIFGGLIGALIVDPISGAMFEFDNPTVNASLPTSQEPRAALAAALPPKVEEAAVVNDVSIQDKLMLLKKLKDQGAISDTEFQAKKKELLEKL